MWIDDAWRIGASAVFFVIAIVAVTRTTDNSLARSLAAFSLGMSTYVVLELTSTRTGIRPLTWAENAVAALSIAAGVELLVGFVGRRRELARFRTASRIAFALLALAALSPFVEPKLAALQREGVWQLALAAAMLFFFGVAGAHLVLHYRTSGAGERARVQLLFGSLLLGAGSAAITLLHDAGMPAPRVLEPGLAGSGLLLALLVLRSRLLETATKIALANVLLAALLVVLGEVALYAWVGEDTAFFVFGTLVLVLAAFAAIRPLIVDNARARARAEHHAALGRLASQMAHDVRNPLAAVLGAAEILEEERAQGRSLDEQAALVTLVLEQAKRLRTVIDDYQRLARVEPKRGPVDVAAMITALAEAQRLAAPRGVTIAVEVPSGLPELQADGDMLAVAVENVLRNAFEAMPEGGPVLLRAAREERGLADAVRIDVVDAGKGMDARTLERAREMFFTTKPTGSGLGLAYAARVLEAHGGELAIASQEGKGTTVTLTVPTAAGAPAP
jgi:signal transduction histidine kinase